MERKLKPTNTRDEAQKFFVGGVSPFLRFEIQYHSLCYLVESHKNDEHFVGNPASEVAWVGCIAHFEAFCKHQFAALINICPALVQDFSAKRTQASLKLSEIVAVLESFKSSIGCLLAEQYDFGSANLINGLFRDLLAVTPFSKDEAKSFDAILRKRHLLVHHGGTYTLRYVQAAKPSDKIPGCAFRDSILITTEMYHDMSDFLFQMAMKITRATSCSLRRRLRGRKQNSEPLEGIRRLFEGLYDSLDESGKRK